MSGLDVELGALISSYNAAIANPATGPAAQQQFRAAAVGMVRDTGTRVQADLDDYDAVVANRAARVESLGYGSSPRPPVAAPTLSGIDLGGLLRFASRPGTGAALAGATAQVAVPRPVPAPRGGGVVGLVLFFLGVLIAAASSDDPGVGGDNPPAPPPPGRIDESRKTFSPAERAIAEKLAAEGRHVEALPEAAPNKQPDAIVDGSPTEFKSLDPTSDQSTHVGRSLTSGEGQALDIIVDARGTSMSKGTATAGVEDYLQRKPGAYNSIRVLTRDGEISFP